MDKDALMQRLMRTFLGELEEHVRALDRDLLILEREPDAATKIEVFRSLFRIGHSLKGAARAVNVSVLEAAGHHLESIFASARDGVLNLDSNLFELLFAAVNAIKEVARLLETGGDLSNCTLAALILRLEAAHISQASALPPTRAALPPTRAALPPTSAALPPTDAALPSTNSASGRRADENTAVPLSAAAIASDKAHPTGASEAFVRVASARLDRLLALGGELRAVRNQTVGRDADLQRLLEMARRWATQWQVDENSVRRLRRRIGDAEAPSDGATASPLPATRLFQIGKENLQWLTRQLEHLADGLAADRQALDQVVVPFDSELMRARMVPFASACEGLDRAARDVAKISGKEVELTVEGGEIEIDRLVVAGIKDALLHLTRNAVDHGIESPAARVAAGKPERGRITLSAALRQGQVEIVVADDGHGFDIEAIRAEAQKRGHPVPKEDNAIARLAFTPGFTTSPGVTAISGRGVGLDVVAAAVESQRGRYNVSCEAGRGSRVYITVPLTLTRLPTLSVMAGGQIYAFDSAAVRGLCRVGASELRPMEGRDVLLSDGAPVPVFRLVDILGQQGSETSQVGSKVAVVILGAGTERAAFIVDELLSEEEVVVKDLGPRLRHVSNVVGATILSTGRIALILSAADLLHTAFGQAPGRAPSDLFASGPSATKKRILVADDSVTTRTLVKSILEAAMRCWTPPTV